MNSAMLKEDSISEVAVMKRLLLVCAAVPVFAFAARSAAAENLTLTGTMSSTIDFQIEKSVRSVPGIKKMVMSFVVPPAFSSPTYTQSVDDLDLSFIPPPQEKERQSDDRGNEIIVATWTTVPESVTAKFGFRATTKTILHTLETTAPFPLSSVPETERIYLAATEQVQSDNRNIQEKAREIVGNAVTEYDAVQRILTWIVDHVRYVTPPDRYDALFTLESSRGNCQNFSHLAAALMRALGIPARIVNGITLKEPLHIKHDGGVYTVKMGQGRHSWIEVWFPDLKWVPLDPQQTALFVANRFIRIEVGVDNAQTVQDGRLRWRQQPDVKNQLSSWERINAEFPSDEVRMQGRRESYGPKNVLMTPAVAAAFVKSAYKPPPAPELPEKLVFDVPVRFGNLLFPENIDFAFPPTAEVAIGKEEFESHRDFYVETAEYVTTKGIQYAQAFVVVKPLKLKTVSLALHCFGGDGQVWVDLYDDMEGIPGAPRAASRIVEAGDLASKPGYRWADFTFEGEGLTLSPGRYWIGLGYAGNPVINWFFTYGKPVGPVDGTRYRGIFDEKWSGFLSYEFNYAVCGATDAR